MKKNRNVLVTGANGYLGSHLVKALLKKGDTVWAVVRSKESDISKIDRLDGCNIIICPLAEIEALPSKIECDTLDICYHLAWFSGSKLRGPSLLEQEALIAQSIKLLNSVSQKQCNKFIGTGSILETNASLPLASHPNMVYSVTKDCTNKLLSLRARELEIQYTWCRLCGLYGNNDRTGNLVSYTISQLKSGVSPTYQNGMQPYSFIHVEDCANALVRIGENSVAPPELLTISGPECKTIREYMSIIQHCIAPDIPLSFGARADDGVRYREDMFDNTILREQLGIVYEHDFEKEIHNIKRDE